MTLEELVVLIKGDVSNLTQGIDKAENEVKNFESGMQNLSKKVDTALKGISFAYVGSQIKSFATDCAQGYNELVEAETKLSTVMQQRMGATQSSINSIIQLTEAQEQLGVVDAETLKMGAQQMATFLTQEESIQTLIPAMGNLLAQQNGLNATMGDAVNIGNLMGKVMQGQTAALTRVGITFSEAQEQVLQFGTETEKAATLAQVITDNVGNMNEALAQTDAGQMKQLEMEFGAVKDAIGEAVMEIGVALLPMAEEFTDWLTQATENIPGLIANLTELALAVEAVYAAVSLLSGNYLGAVAGIGAMAGTYYIGTNAYASAVTSQVENSGNVDAFASGGVLTQPTFGLMAEYSGAKTNPEIITPQSIMYDTVSKALKENMQSSNQKTIVNSVLKLDGQTIYRNQNKTKISRGYEFAGLGGFVR